MFILWYQWWSFRDLDVYSFQEILPKVNLISISFFNRPGGCLFQNPLNSCHGFLSPLYLQPGAMVPKSSCENCVCMDEQDPVTQTNRIQCLPVQCQTTCQQVSTSLTTMPDELKQGQCNCFICATQQDRLFYWLFCKVLFRVRLFLLQQI